MLFQPYTVLISKLPRCHYAKFTIILASFVYHSAAQPVSLSFRTFDFMTPTLPSLCRVSKHKSLGLPIALFHLPLDAPVVVMKATIVMFFDEMFSEKVEANTM